MLAYQDEDETRQEVPGGAFQKTHWTLIFQAARDPADTCAHDALARLCESYWMPLYCYVRSQGRKPEEAEDLTQDFFAHFLQKNGLAAADPAKGRFRSFLLQSLKNFMASQWKKEKARKRNPGSPILSFNAAEAETHYRSMAVDRASPDRIYQRDCAWALVEQALGRLRAYYKARGKAELFEVLSPTLMGEDLSGSYEELARQLGATETALWTEASRMRKRLKNLLKEMLLPISGSRVDREAELKALFEALIQ